MTNRIVHDSIKPKKRYLRSKRLPASKIEKSIISIAELSDGNKFSLDESMQKVPTRPLPSNVPSGNSLDILTTTSCKESSTNFTKAVCGLGSITTKKKNEILAIYQDKFSSGSTKSLVSSSQGKRIASYKSQLPSNHRLVRDCKMKPSLDIQYRVEDLQLSDIAVSIVKRWSLYFGSNHGLWKLACLNKLWHKMVSEVLRLKDMDFTPLLDPRLDYETQTEISQHRVDMATAGMIKYEMNPGMFGRCISGLYTGEERDVDATCYELVGHVETEDLNHIRRILTQGCPARLNFDEPSHNKMSALERGNQKSFDEYPDIVQKTMNKEDKYSHLLTLAFWTVYFSPYCRHTSQGMVIKIGKNARVVWDASTKMWALEIVLNEITDTEFEAIISFGAAKMKLYTCIYNMRVSYPSLDILLAMADVKACFRFPRMHIDAAGAFGFKVKNLYFLATSMVFGSNTSATSWEPFRRAIEAMTLVYFNKEGLVEKHKHYLDMIIWEDEPEVQPVFVQAVACDLNPGVLDEQGNMKPVPTNIYVDDALLACVGKENMMKALAAVIEAIFIVMGKPNTLVKQCPLAMDKWVGMMVRHEQTMLGLRLNTRRLSVGTTIEYNAEVRKLLIDNWPYEKTTFFASEMQTLIGKLGRLGEGAHWIYKLMSHIYTSLAYALRKNKELLNASNQDFKNLVQSIEQNQFKGTKIQVAKQVNFTLKKAAQMQHKARFHYVINPTMREEIDFIRQALDPDSGIKFETPFGLIIPRMPLGDSPGDSSLTSGGAFCIPLRYWWYIYFPEEIRQRTIKYLKKGDENLISINVLEFVVIIINYCVAVTVVKSGVTKDPHPVICFITDNTSALNWTLHTSKTSLIGRALARFFCGLLIGSPVGINSKWIGTHVNVIADKISRFDPSSCEFESFEKLKQEYPQLKPCRSFQLNPDLLSMIWNILLTKKCPDLKQVEALKLKGFGKLSI